MVCHKCDATMDCPDCSARAGRKVKVTLYNSRYILYGGARAVEGNCPLCNRKWIKVLRK